MPTHTSLSLPNGLMQSQPLFLRLLLLSLLCALAIGCKRKANTEDHVETEEQRVDPRFGPIQHHFVGELTEEADRRPEDNSPVDIYDIEVEEGQIVHVYMEGLEAFGTYLMIATPSRTGGKRNQNCLPGVDNISCIRFKAEETGLYRIYANSYDENNFGRYVLNVFFETEEEAIEREKQLAVDREVAQRAFKERQREALEAKLAPLIEAIAEQREKNAANKATDNESPDVKQAADATENSGD